MSASDAAQLAVQKGPNPFPKEQGMPGWTTQDDDNHYDPCADLSWITIGISGGTASSPYQIALFHRGTYLGTATKQSYGFFPQVSRINGSSIQSTYTYPRGTECNACATGRATARFTWNDASQHVVMSGDVPPDEQG